MTTPDPNRTDQQARHAAARLHDDVVGTVDLEAAQARVARPTRQPAVVALTIAAVVALVAGVFLIKPGSGDVEVAVDEDGTSTSLPDEAAPDIESMPTPIALGAPDDGKDSVGLPVDADPKTGLTDGQIITVTGAQFPPNESVGVVMCTREAGQDDGGRGVEACNIGHFGQGTTDGQGNVSVDFSIRRFVTLDGQEVDCASEPGRCIIGMGLLSDYDQSGGVALDFDPDVPAPEPPTASLSKADDLADGESVELSLTGLVPNSSVYVQQCSEQVACTQSSIDEMIVGPDGTYDGTIRVWRQFGSYGFDGRPTNVDCLSQACKLEIQGEAPGSRAIPGIALSFVAGGDSRSAPTVTLLDDGPFSVGSTFSIEVSGIRRGDFVEASICPSPEQGCVAFGVPDGPSSGGFQILEVRVETSDQDCERGCLLTVSIYSESAGLDGGPPPLFPEPIPVTITG